MKIALVCPYDLSYPGGVQNHVLQYASYVSKLGIQVTIIAPFSRESFQKDHPDINYVNGGVPTPIPMGMATVSRVTLDPRQLFKIRRMLRKDGYDVVHVHAPDTPLLGLWSLLWARSSLVAATFHANYGKSFYPITYNTFSKIAQIHRLANKIDVRLAVSETAKDAVSRFFPGNYLVIPNGIDMHRFSPEVKPIESNIDEKVKRIIAKYPSRNLTKILTVGRMGNHERRKGLRYVIGSFGRLHNRRPDTMLMVVGPGKPDTDTVAEFNKLDSGTREHIVFVGEVSGSVLPEYYALADICTFAATGKESFGYVLGEGMASGKPVVASNIRGYDTVLLGSNGHSDSTANKRSVQTAAGILVEPKNSDAFAEALELLVDRSDLREVMGEAGRDIVVQNFAWEKVAERILGVYEQAIAKKMRLRAAV